MIKFLSLFFAVFFLFTGVAFAHITPRVANISFLASDVARHAKQKIYFDCDGKDKKVTSISVTCHNLNGSIVSWSVRMVNGESFVEVTPVKAGGDVTLELTAKGDGGSVYKGTLPVLFR